MDDDESRRYRPLTILLIWVSLLALSWALAIILGYLVYKFLLLYLPLVVCVWEFYWYALQKLYDGNAE